MSGRWTKLLPLSYATFSGMLGTQTGTPGPCWCLQTRTSASCDVTPPLSSSHAQAHACVGPVLSAKKGSAVVRSGLLQDALAAGPSGRPGAGPATTRLLWRHLLPFPADCLLLGQPPQQGAPALLNPVTPHARFVQQAHIPAALPAAKYKCAAGKQGCHELGGCAAAC